jgi:hypothetical protein
VLGRRADPSGRRAALGQRREWRAGPALGRGALRGRHRGDERAVRTSLRASTKCPLLVQCGCSWRFVSTRKGRFWTSGSTSGASLVHIMPREVGCPHGGTLNSSYPLPGWSAGRARYRPSVRAVCATAWEAELESLGPATGYQCFPISRSTSYFIRASQPPETIWSRTSFRIGLEGESCDQTRRTPVYSATTRPRVGWIQLRREARRGYSSRGTP